MQNETGTLFVNSEKAECVAVYSEQMPVHQQTQYLLAQRMFGSYVYHHFDALRAVVDETLLANF